MKVAAVLDSSGRLPGRLAMLGAVGLLLASLIPAVGASVGWLYLGVALLSGLAHAVVALQFLAGPTDAHARALWRISLVHLPVLLTALLLVRG